MKVQRQVLETRESIPIRISEGEIDKKRRERVGQALQNLTRVTGKKFILDFLPTKNHSFNFHVVFVSEVKHRFLRLAVTSRYWLEVMKRMHPRNTTIAVDLIETLESIENKIIRAIVGDKYTKH